MAVTPGGTTTERDTDQAPRERPTELLERAASRCGQRLELGWGLSRQLQSNAKSRRELRLLNTRHPHGHAMKRSHRGGPAHRLADAALVHEHANECPVRELFEHRGLRSRAHADDDVVDGVL